MTKILLKKKKSRQHQDLGSTRVSYLNDGGLDCVKELTLNPKKNNSNEVGTLYKM